MASFSTPSENEFDNYFRQFGDRVQSRFRRENMTKAVKMAILDATPRLRSNRVLVDSVEASVVSSPIATSDPRLLARFHWEDIPRLQIGTPLKSFVHRDAAAVTKKWYTDIFVQAIAAQEVKHEQLNAQPYYALDVTIIEAPEHCDFIAGNHSKASVRNLFDRNEGFTVGFRNCLDLPFTLAWVDVLHHCQDFMFFGPARHRNRLYNDLFKNKSDLSTIRKIFYVSSFETAGDFTASNLLINAYLSAENLILKDQLSAARNPPNEKLMTIREIIPENSSSVIVQINNDCLKAFKDAVSNWTDHHQSYISDEMYNNWICRVAFGFPRLWNHFHNIRGLFEKDKRVTHLLPGKERQVFHDILGTIRRRDGRKLIWWALIETMALLSWGVGSTAQDLLAYWGTHLSGDQRDKMLKTLFDAEQYTALSTCFVSLSCIIFIIDNFQRGQRLKNQRSGRFSNFVAPYALLPHLNFP